MYINNLTKNELGNRFSIFYYTASLEFINSRRVPEEIIQRFELLSERFIGSKDYFQDNFEFLFRVINNPDHIVYGAQQTRNLIDPAATEKLTYIFDVNKRDVVIGHGEIRFNVTSNREFFLKKPFVGINMTEDIFQRKGFGSKRLLLMDALSKTFFGYALNSDTLLTKNAELVWKKFVSKGLAKHYKEGPHNRYVFL